MRIPPKLAIVKHQYKIDESPRVSLLYDPRMSFEAIHANVSYYDFFSESKESIRFEKAKDGLAEAHLHPLPP